MWWELCCLCPLKKKYYTRMCFCNRQNTAAAQILKCVYSGISIYRPRNVRFPIFTMHHLWSRIKFHINVIYFRIHQAPNCRFSAFIACKLRSRHSISRMVHLRKKIEASYLCGIRVAHQHHMWQTVCMYTVYPYLFALHSLRFPCDLQFQIVNISFNFQ
jgi:hypothetical protein